MNHRRIQTDRVTHRGRGHHHMLGQHRRGDVYTVLVEHERVAVREGVVALKHGLLVVGDRVCSRLGLYFAWEYIHIYIYIPPTKP